MELTDYRPQSMLVTQERCVEKPRFPVVDAHNHLGVEFGGGWEQHPVAELLGEMDQAGVEILVDLDGGWGEEILTAHLKKFKEAAPERFCVFGGVDWRAWAEQGRSFPDWAAERLRLQVQRGAQGLKIWKPFGLQVRDPQGQLVEVDDHRLDPIWAEAASLNIPVLIHVADPVAFFRPLDQFNERWEELNVHPNWQFPSPPFPSFETIVNGMRRLVERHPQTTFIAAHVGCYAENLGWVSQVLDDCPNMYVDIAARIAELGRQPYTARRFFLKYSERILFGLDLPAMVDVYRLHYRFLESEDEYFPYDVGPVPTQGRWRIYGLNLPDEVLCRVYRDNARRVILHQ